MAGDFRGERAREIVRTIELPPAGMARQQALPPWRRLLRLDGDVGFAHPAERVLAGILSYYRVRWTYEPTTFGLAWHPDGRPAELFTPDFYLPDHRLYIELTTMRQRLVTRKNRKARLLREHYPNVRIKLLYGRDYRRLLASYPASIGVCRTGQILFSEDQIHSRTRDLADRIIADYASVTQPVLALAVGGGAEAFRRTLVARFAARGFRVEEDRLDITRFRPGGEGRCVRVQRGPLAEIGGRQVLLIENVVSTGLSVAYLAGWLRRRGAAQVDVCTLLDRRVARLLDVPVRYAAFEAPGDLLAGFGLDLGREFRHLPFIAVLERQPECAETGSDGVADARTPPGPVTS